MLPSLLDKFFKYTQHIVFQILCFLPSLMVIYYHVQSLYREYFTMFTNRRGLPGDPTDHLRFFNACAYILYLVHQLYIKFFLGQKYISLLQSMETSSNSLYCGREVAKPKTVSKHRIINIECSCFKSCLQSIDNSYNIGTCRFGD